MDSRRRGRPGRGVAERRAGAGAHRAVPRPARRVREGHHRRARGDVGAAVLVDRRQAGSTADPRRPANHDQPLREPGPLRRRPGSGRAGAWRRRGHVQSRAAPSHRSRRVRGRSRAAARRARAAAPAAVRRPPSRARAHERHRGSRARHPGRRGIQNRERDRRRGSHARPGARHAARAGAGRSPDDDSRDDRDRHLAAVAGGDHPSRRSRPCHAVPAARDPDGTRPGSRFTSRPGLLRGGRHAHTPVLRRQRQCGSHTLRRRRTSSPRGRPAARRGIDRRRLAAHPAGRVGRRRPAGRHGRRAREQAQARGVLADRCLAHERGLERGSHHHLQRPARPALPHRRHRLVGRRQAAARGDRQAPGCEGRRLVRSATVRSRPDEDSGRIPAARVLRRRIQAIVRGDARQSAGRSGCHSPPQPE